MRSFTYPTLSIYLVKFLYLYSTSLSLTFYFCCFNCFCRSCFYEFSFFCLLILLFSKHFTYSPLHTSPFFIIIIITRLIIYLIDCGSEERVREKVCMCVRRKTLKKKFFFLHFIFAGFLSRPILPSTLSSYPPTYSFEIIIMIKFIKNNFLELIRETDNRLTESRVTVE